MTPTTGRTLILPTASLRSPGCGWPRCSTTRWEAFPPPSSSSTWRSTRRRCNQIQVGRDEKSCCCSQLLSALSLNVPAVARAGRERKQEHTGKAAYRHEHYADGGARLQAALSQS